MKKILIIVALAFVLASCDPKDTSICVDKFYASPVEYVGKNVTITGHAKICCCSGDLILVGCSKDMIRVVPAEGVAAPELNDTTFLKVKGIISENVIDEQLIATLREKAAATADSAERVQKLAMVDALKVGDSNYTINATSIEAIKACCKDKAGKECCKGKEGCEKKCEGQPADSTKACPTAQGEGCAKKCEGQPTAQGEGCAKKCEGEKKS